MGPSLFQTGAEAEESGSFLCGEFVPQSSCSQICQMRFTFLHSVQADVPGLLKVAGNKSIVWIDRFIAATRLIRPEAGFFQHEFGLAYAVVGFSNLMVNGVQGRFDAQWLQRTQDRGADYLVHALGSERDATFAVTRVRATALITRRLRVSVVGLRPGAKATETPPDPNVGAPVLDSTQ